MRKLLALTGATAALVLSASITAQAGEEVATRCGQFGCDQVRCDHSGNRCVRFSNYDSYYNGYTNGPNGGYGYGNEYGYNGYDSYGYNNGYGGYAAPAYGTPPVNNYNGGAPYAYSNGYYGGYGPGNYVCDSEGDRCYQSSSPYWDFHEYYRLHGYRWNY
jgi:hypothetical protein